MSSTARRIGLYTVLALCCCAFAYVEGRSDEADALTIQHAYSLLASHTTYQRVQDSLGRVERGFVAEETRWRRMADSIGAASQTQVTVSNGSPHDTAVAPDSGSHLPSDSLRVVFLGRALDSCDLSRGAADSALARCALRGDSLEASLRAVLATRTCRVLFFPCPSRTVTFFTGALLGAVVESRLR